MSDVTPVRRALLSVHDRTGLVDLARGLVDAGVELISSGGTAAALRDGGVPVREVADVTGSPEILGGRVKTLHPAVHGGILADRSDAAHMADLEAQGIEPVDLVVSNLYPFLESPDIETIDIGGVTLTRAAAKNHAWVGILTDPSDYAAVVDEVRSQGGLTAETRLRLAQQAFARTAAYDAAIAGWMGGAGGAETGGVVSLDLADRIPLTLDRAFELRYGENPHQEAAFYRQAGRRGWWERSEILGGREVSFNNLADSDGAWRLVLEFDQPACAIIKHANPCGVAVGADIVEAYVRAHECDPLSAFGGIVALNRPATAGFVEALGKVFTEVVIAPDYEADALERLRAKNKGMVRILKAPMELDRGLDVRSVGGGFLVQTPDSVTFEDWRVVTKRQPTGEQMDDLRFAWIVTAHTKSNSVVLVKDGQAVGIGAGDQSRVGAAERAAKQAAGRAKGGVAASEALFPFPDGVEACAEAGATAIVQPGGSAKDDDVIAAADDLGVAMVFTGRRHFRHA